MASLDVRVDRENDIPLGVQLAWALKERIANGTLEPGDRLPSVRELAAEAGVNVNTVRAVYARLEQEGLTRSEQGRGTFVSAAADEGRSEAEVRRELRNRIAKLEAELVRRPQLPAEASAGGASDSARLGRLPSTDELAAIHDELLARLRRLDEDREEIVRRLEELRAAHDPAAAPTAPEAEPDRRSSVSLKGARVRWVGA